VAVAHVVINRVANDEFPESICQVIRQGGETLNRCQFSWWCDGKPDVPTNPDAWQQAIATARSVLAGESIDPTGGALYFHNEGVNPPWTGSLIRTGKIDAHVFYR